MDRREKDLSDIKSFTEEIDKEMTLILQSLQWDRKHLMEAKQLVQCKYDSGHRIPAELKDQHEEQCYVKMQGYTDDDELLPDPLDPTASTLVKLNDKDICMIINIAATSDPHFKRVVFTLRGTETFSIEGPPPLSLARLQAAYSPDERRAIHSAVVAAAPACHDLTDLTLLGSDEPSTSKQPKSRLQILTELRNMKRRRTKYRVACKTKNYSDVLRDVITSQMELYTGVKTEPITIKPEPDMPAPLKIKHEFSSLEENENTNKYEEDNYMQRVIKKEPRYKTEDRVRNNRDKERRYNRSEGNKDYKDDRRHKERDRTERSRDRDRNGRSRDRDKNERSGDKDRNRHNTSKDYRHDRGKIRERSRDRRNEERHNRHDRSKSNGSHNHSDVKIKEEKRKRDSYDNHDRKRR